MCPRTAVDSGSDYTELHVITCLAFLYTNMLHNTIT